MRWTALHMLLVAVLAALPLPGLAACLQASCAMAALDESPEPETETDAHACCADANATSAEAPAPDAADPCCCDHAESERGAAFAPTRPELTEALDDLSAHAVLPATGPSMAAVLAPRRRAELRPLTPRGPPPGPRLPLRVVNCVWRC